MSLHLDQNYRLFGFGITVSNVNEALPLGLKLVQQHGVEAESRGLKTLRVPGPVTTVYKRPWERVLFDQHRDANPFFHLFESLWILGGADTLAMPKFFLKRYEDFSDNGRTLHGAYGYRLRHWRHGNGQIDQLEGVIKLLKDKPDTRQAVISIWDPALDLGAKTKDMPCNDMVMFDIVDDKLNMTVCNRSNDVIWGAYGANAVQFSVLQEYVAASVGVGIGYYVQMSNNYHVYVDNPFWQRFLNEEYDYGHVLNPYETKLPDANVCIAMCNDDSQAFALRQDSEYLNTLIEHGLANLALTSNRFAFKSDFFHHTALWMLQGYMCYKAGDFVRAYDALSRIKSPDWKFVCIDWVARRDKTLVDKKLS